MVGFMVWSNGFAELKKGSQLPGCGRRGGGLSSGMLWNWGAFFAAAAAGLRTEPRTWQEWVFVIAAACGAGGAARQSGKAIAGQLKVSGTVEKK